MNTAELAATAHAMVSKNRGLLAADESTSTILKRFNTIKLDSTEETRRAYREMLFTTPGASEYISGVILYDETIRQKTKDGVPFPAYLSQHNMIPGIKVDTGAKPLAGFPGETITEGLDGLRERLAEYDKLGARFAKWRAVIDIGAGIPTRYAIDANAEGLGALCGALPGSRDRSDRRARSADGRRSSDRALRGSHERGIAERLRSSVRRPHRARGHGAQAEHGDRRQEKRQESLRPSRWRRPRCAR